MPFTPAHPAIILPLLRRRLFSATGLIVGSISPDFEYFFRAKTLGIYGHTIPGLFYFDLPVCILIAFIFHLAVKVSFIANLPGFLQRRFHFVLELDFIQYFKNRYWIFIMSALIGALSHIVWDGFTHKGTFFVNYFSFYEGSYIPFDGAKYPLWYALQHVSTITGLTILAMYIFFMPSDESVLIKSPRFDYWLFIILLSGVLFAIRFTLFTVPFRIGNIVVSSISALLLATFLVSLLPVYKPVRD